MDQTTQTNKPTGLYILGIILLVAIAAGLWYFLSELSTDPGSETTDEEGVDMEGVAEDASPSGYIYFSAYSTENKNSFPLIYDVSERSLVDVPFDAGTFYHNITPVGDALASIQADFVSTALDEPFMAYRGDLDLIGPGVNMTLSDLVSPRNFQWSETAQAFLVSDLSREYVNSVEREEYFASENYRDIENWSVYIIESGNESMAEAVEITEAASPVWSSSGEGLYFSAPYGIAYYDMRTQETTTLGTLPEGRFVNAGTDIALVADESELYVLSPSRTNQDDKIFRFTLDWDREFILDHAETFRLPAGSHRHLSLSPDERFASVTVYDEDEREKEFRVIDVSTGEMQDSLFRWPVWTIHSTNAQWHADLIQVLE